ncbi:MAG: hypothetical protein AB8I08_38980 [Sandaracinaceae bacterium]
MGSGESDTSSLALPTLVAEFRGGLMVAAHPNGEIHDSDWAAAISACRVCGATRRLVFSDGARPNAGQRKHALAFFAETSTARASIVGGTSPLLRGAVTALTWLIPEDRFRSAFSFINNCGEPHPPKGVASTTDRHRWVAERGVDLVMRSDRVHNRSTSLGFLEKETVKLVDRNFASPQGVLGSEGVTHERDVDC